MGKEDISVNSMWHNYLISIDEDVNNTNKEYTSWYFCNNKKDADNLAQLVRDGIKRGTTSLYCLYNIENEELPKDDEYSIITDWNGIAQCVIKNIKVSIIPFNDVDDKLAEIEGEGDKSLDYWRKVHTDIFTKELQQYKLEFSDNMSVVFEEFEMVFKL